jgi:hypothetical protein
MTRAGKTGLAIVVALFVVTTALVVGASAQVVNPDATIVVANLHPVEGETVEIHNAANDASRCEGGVPVVFVGGLPPGILSQLVGDPDENGDWSVNLEVPFQADWPSNYVGGPYLLETSCFEETATGGPSASASPPFAYEPVVVTLSVAVVPPVVTPPVPEAALVAAPLAAPVPAAGTVVIAPAFTG